MTKSVVLNGVFLPDNDYEVQAQYIPYSSRETLPSDWLAVTTPNILIGTNDILDAAITELKLADEAVSTAKLQVAAVTEEILSPDSVTNQKIADAAVEAAQLADQAVTSLKLANEAVSSIKLADNAVTQAKINDAAVTASKIKAGAIDATKFASGITPIEIVSTLPTTDNFEGRQVYNTSDGVLYTYHDDDWTALEATVGPGSITATEIADGAITTPKLATNSVVASKIASGAITTDKLDANAITAGKIAAGAIGTTQLAAGAVTTDILAAGSVSSGKIAAGSITSRELIIGSFDNLISNPGLETGTLFPHDGNSNWVVGSTAYARSGLYVLRHNADTQTDRDSFYLQGQPNASAGNITAAAEGDQFYGEVWVQPVGSYSAWNRVRLLIFVRDGNYVSIGGGANSGYYTPTSGWAKLSCATPPLPSGAAFVQLAVQIENDGHDGTLYLDDFYMRRMVGGDLIVDGSITAAKVDANAITSDKIASNAVTAGKIDAGAVTASAIAANSVTSEKIAAGSITAREMVLTDFHNLVPDNQILDPTGSWNNTADVTAARASSTNYTSAYKYIFAVDPGEDAPPGFVESLPFPIFSSDAKYRVRYQHYSAEDSYRVVGYIKCFDHNGTDLGNTIIDGTTRGGGAVRYVDEEFNPPNYTKTALLRFYVTGVTGSGSRTVEVAGPYIGLKDAASLVVDGGITADKIAAGSITAGKIASGSVTTSKIQSGAVTADKITVSSLAALGITVGTADIQNAAITSSKLFRLGVSL